MLLSSIFLEFLKHLSFFFFPLRTISLSAKFMLVNLFNKTLLLSKLGCNFIKMNKSLKIWKKFKNGIKTSKN